MIYLDYAANTPVNEEVLQTFCAVSRKYIANPNSHHQLGRLADECLNEASRTISEILHVKTDEIIYTSGATESNNLAIKGIAQQYKKFGRHIITTYLEHSSVIGAVSSLQSCGFEVDYVGVGQDGLVDLDELKELLRDDTILVSICYVDSEVGIRQQIEKIGKLLAGYPHCFFHVDGTQATGKIPVNLTNVDLYSFSPHKFYGINGCGVLIKKEPVLLEPLIHGGVSTTPFRSGTPAFSLIVSTAKALTLAYENMQERYDSVQKLNHDLRQALKLYHKIRVNSTECSVPYILNLCIDGAKSEDIQAELSKNNIYVSTKSACCAPNTVSRPVFAITQNKKAALNSLRISLSHLTTPEEIGAFLNCFDSCYKKLVKQG
jgi:cysteine desulfurase